LKNELNYLKEITMATFESRLKKLEALAGVPVSKHIERLMEMDDDAIAQYANG
jgi:hypothetical protein